MQTLKLIQSKHTPGPWIADDAFMMDGASVRVGTAFQGGQLHQSKTICECWFDGASDDPQDRDGIHVVTAEANARLIASAPDLLEALQMICDSGVPLADPIEKAMLSAIDKAMGVQS